MTKTTAELSRLALKNIGVMPQTGKVYTSIIERVPPLLASLLHLDIADIPFPDAIDDQYFIPLGHILADEIKSEYPEGRENSAALYELRKIAEMDIRTMQSQRYTRQILEGQYF